MDRKEYLEICQKNSASFEKIGVFCGGVEYYPKEYVLWFDRYGSPRHSAVMVDKSGVNQIRCNLEDCYMR